MTKLKKSIPSDLTALTINQIAEALNLNYRTVLKDMSEGKLRGFQTRGGWRVSYLEYKRYFEALSGDE